MSDLVIVESPAKAKTIKNTSAELRSNCVYGTCKRFA